MNVPMSAAAKRQLLLERMMRERSAAPAAAPVSPLVTLTPDRQPPAFFCVHASGGSAAPYLPLARELAHGFHALEAPGIHGGQPLERVEDLAGCYLEAIRAVCPAGPYHLGGWSIGGTIALEMACRLGEEAACLVLLDTTALRPDDPAPSEREILTRFVFDIAQLQDRAVPRLTLSDVDRYGDTAACLEDSGLVPAELREQTMNRMRVFVANTRAFYAYRPKVFKGRTLLVSAEGSPPVYRDRWRQLLPRLQIRTVPGTHYTMLRPPVLGQVADAVREFLTVSQP
jgi:thioesterase domain-containing protein